MPEPLSISSTAVDLSRLPAPTVVEQLSFEAIFDAMLVDLQLRMPSFTALVESDPAYKLLQVCAYRELLLRQNFNDRARQVMVAFATGANLDQLAVLVGVTRLVVDAGDPASGIDPTLETDASLRQRIVLAPDSFSVAGPELAYVFHAKSADAAVLDASAISPAPGEVLVSVLSRNGSGTASSELIAAVEATVNARPVRPLTDVVTVQSAEILPFTVTASIYTFAGPDTGIVIATAQAQLQAYLADSRHLGRDITASGIYAALHVEGVQRVVLASWADIVVGATQAAHCTAVTITHAGYAN